MEKGYLMERIWRLACPSPADPTTVSGEQESQRPSKV